jgi:hypothetical protein
MALDYSKRGIWSVHVHGISPSERGEDEGASTAVTIYLAGVDAPTAPGPNITLNFAFPASHELSLRELESEALATAVALLRRFVQETPETLLKVAAQTRAKPPVLSVD